VGQIPRTSPRIRYALQRYPHNFRVFNILGKDADAGPNRVFTSTRGERVGRHPTCSGSGQRSRTVGRRSHSRRYITSTVDTSFETFCPSPSSTGVTDVGRLGRDAHHERQLCSAFSRVGPCSPGEDHVCDPPRPDSNGRRPHGRSSGSRITSRRVSVMSSIAQRMPSRPRPLFLTPP